MSRFGYQSLAEPILPEAVVETVTLDKWWRQPSEPARKVARLAALVGFFLAAPVFVPPAPPVAAQLAGPMGYPRQIQYQAHAAPVLVPVTAPPPTYDPAGLEWLPDEPVVVRRAPRRAGRGDTVGPVRFAFPEARLDWLPDEPTVIRRTPRAALGQSVQPVRFTFPEARLDWLPDEPTVIRRQPRFTPAVPVQPVRFAFPEASLDWLPDEPTVIRRVPRTPQTWFTHNVAPLPGVAFDPATGFPWLQAPEPVRLRPRAINTTRVTAPFSQLPALPHWSPEYPDAIARRILGPAGSPFYAAPIAPVAAPVFDPATGFPWPQSPDVIRRPRRFTPAVPVQPIRFAFPEARLDWLPDEPTVIRRTPRVAATLFVHNLRPIPVQIDWLPDQPTVVRRTPRTPHAWFTLDPFPLPGAAFNPADGFPYVQLPNAPPRRRQAPHSYFVEPIRFAFPEARLDWQPAEPDVIRRTPRTPWSAFAQNVFPITDAFNPADGFPWGQLPSFVLGRRQAPHSFIVEPVRFRFPEAALDWLGNEPPFVVRPIPPAPEGFFVYPIVFDASRFPWIQLPAWVPGPREPLRLLELVEPFTAALFNPAFGFPYSVFPDMVWPAPPLRIHPWLSVLGPIEPIATPPPEGGYEFFVPVRLRVFDVDARTRIYSPVLRVRVFDAPRHVP